MKNKHQSYRIVDAICTGLFCAFAFCYLYFFQADMLAYAQHVLSDGLTTYHPLIGALIICAVLLSVSISTSMLTRHYSYFLPALYHLPSALLLASFTDIHIIDGDCDHVFGNVWVISIAVLLLYFIFYRVLRRLILPPALSTIFSLMQSLCLNLLLMLGLFSYIIICGNTDSDDHMRLYSERQLKEYNYYAVTDIGARQQMSNDHLLMLRAYALAKTNRLGENFFENCNATFGADCLLPGENNHLLMLPAERIYKFVGGIKLKEMPVREYLRLLNKRSLLRENARDYLLVADLLDCDLDAFVEHYSTMMDSTTVVPKHYREALTLYNHIRSNPAIEFSLPEMDADYYDFQTTDRAYRNTYWYYFYSKRQ